MLNILREVPPVFYTASSSELFDHLQYPTLLHLTGEKPEPLFVSVLLHGNESTGWYAVQQLLKEYRENSLPRSLCIFIGNVKAAAKGLRKLDHQPDFNRVWPGTEHVDCAEVELMHKVWEYAREAKVFASIDIHNNTGLNPHYACINRIEKEYLELASYFSRTVVFFTRPEGVQSKAFAEFCPAVTIECGQADQLVGIEHAYVFLKTMLHLHKLGTHHVNVKDLNLYHTVATVKIPPHASFDFAHDNLDADVVFNPDIDHLNFTELDKGFEFATLNTDHFRFEVTDESGRESDNDFFQYDGKSVRLGKSVMPSMITLDKKVIRQDCFCYLMENINALIPVE